MTITRAACGNDGMDVDEDVDVEDFEEKDRGGRNNLKVEKEDLAL